MAERGLKGGIPQASATERAAGPRNPPGRVPVGRWSHVEPRCRCCLSAHRARIEAELAAGGTPAEVLALLPSQHGLTVRNVIEHVRRRHLPFDLEALLLHRAYRTAEVEAQLRTITTDAAKVDVDRALWTVAAGHLMLRDGRLHVTTTSVVQAMRLLADLDRLEQERAREAISVGAAREEHAGSIARLFEIFGEHVDSFTLGTVIRQAVNDRSVLGEMMCCHPSLVDVRLSEARFSAEPVASAA